MKHAIGLAARNWIAVASAEHARLGCSTADNGFMQACHGKVAPLKRIRPGDRVAYYSPATTMRGKDKLQSFVSIGVVKAGAPYAVEMGEGFVPWRREVHYVNAKEAQISPLLDRFEFVDDRDRWGYKFRFGLFEVGDGDMRLIANAMHADVSELGF